MVRVVVCRGAEEEREKEKSRAEERRAIIPLEIPKRNFQDRKSVV